MTKMNAMSSAPLISIKAPAENDPIMLRAAAALRDVFQQMMGGDRAVGRAESLQISLGLQSEDLAPIIARTGDGRLGGEEYAIASERSGDNQHIWIIGADAAACLAGAYKLLTHFGCSFHLYGDVLPALAGPLARIDINERYSPRFSLRGTQLWCYWYSGRDVWDFEAYRSYLDQFPKLGLNLFDFPLYFYEPLYTGYQVGDVRPKGYFLAGRTLDNIRVGKAQFADAPAAFASATIPRYGSDRERSAAAIALMRRVFDYAKSLGIKTCVGIEVANQLDFARDVANALPMEDRYEDGRLIQPSSPSARAVLSARLRALFDAYPMCDYYGLWQSEAGVFRTTGGSRHPDDTALRDRLRTQYSSLEPSDADYISWLRLADEIVGKLKPEVRLVTSGWGSEAVFACADEVLGDRFICSSIAPYEPRLALQSGGLDFYRSTAKEKWNVTWAETDQHMWVMQPKLDATAEVVNRLEGDGVSGIMVLHWNILFCDINLGFYASQCWSPNPTPEEFRRQWAESRYGHDCAKAVVATFAALERLNDLTIESDPTMQSWVGYECFINPLLQSYRFIDVNRPFPESWLATYVAPHLAYADRFLGTLDEAIAHAADAVDRAGPNYKAQAVRLHHRVCYVRGLYACHIQLAEAMQLWNAADKDRMTRALHVVAGCNAESALQHFIDGLDTEAGPADSGELGLLLSLNEKFLGGIARLKGRMERAISGTQIPFHAVADGALLAIWPGMNIETISLLARDDPHAPSAAPAAGLPREPAMDRIEGSANWSVTVSEGVTSQRFGAELGFWRHLETIRVTIEAHDYTEPVFAHIYLCEDTDWDSLFRRQSISVNGETIAECDDFLSRGDDMSEGYWVTAPCHFIDSKLTIDIVRQGNSDVIVSGIVVTAD
jgi:hypothetical protein